MAGWFPQLPYLNHGPLTLCFPFPLFAHSALSGFHLLKVKKNEDKQRKAHWFSLSKQEIFHLLGIHHLWMKFHRYFISIMANVPDRQSQCPQRQWTF